MNAQRGGGRTIVALFLLAGGIAAILWATRARSASGVRLSRLTWIATAHQFGPVGYRDPAGAVSRDGRWIAYSEGRFLRVRPAAGGPTLDLPASDSQIRNLTWNPDNRTILTDGFATAGGWGEYDIVSRQRKPLHAEIRQLAWSPDGTTIAGIGVGETGLELRTLRRDGTPAKAEHAGDRIAFPAYAPDGRIACITTRAGRSRISLPCGGAAIDSTPDADAYGPIAFSPDSRTIYVGIANAQGTVDLWAVPTRGGAARQLTFFSRDTYAPSVTADGRVFFKLQDYRTHVAVVPAEGGSVRALATFQSETPSWDPTGKWLGITYGTWRRQPDDAHYPDIAQDTGIIGVDPDHPAEKVARVVHDSQSEDQSLCWSPNGRWIAFHSHKDQSDDVWLEPADGRAPPVRISFLGRGAETGWPRWSPDGTRVLFTGADPATHKIAAFIVGLDQATGAVTRPAQVVAISGVDGSVAHAEWIGSDRLAVINEEAGGRDAIYTVAAAGGPAANVYRFATEHHAPGLGASPDGKTVAFVAPAPDGFYQLFRMTIGNGSPVQVTRDPSNKTQPAWSPDGRAIAFTVWSYEAQFWMLEDEAAPTAK